MRPSTFAFLFALSFSAGSAGCRTSQRDGAVAPKPAATPAWPAAAPAQRVSLESVGLDPAAIDKKADPCRDFYQFACGGWLAKTEVPGDKARWFRSFNQIQDANEAALRRILEQAAEKPEGDPVLAQLGSFYGSCMNEPAIEAAKLTPLAPLLKNVRAARDLPSLSRAIAALHDVGIWAVFDISAEQDFKDATRYIAYLDQNGLGLPDRDYYVKQDERSKALRETYRAHVARMLALGGQSKARAEQASQAVLKIETALAEISKTQVERRDPAGLYNKIDRAGVERAVPRFDWKRYFETIGHSAIVDVNVTSLKFFEGLNALLGSVPLQQWRDYLEWHLLHSSAPALPAAFVDESFKLEQALTGQKEQRVRWKRCVQATDAALGELLAQPFVRERFSGESKPVAEAMVRQIRDAFGRELERLDWMDEPTRKRAREKLERMAFLIGYPDKWKSYDFELRKHDYAHNFLVARGFEIDRQLKKIGGPVDRSEWDVTPPTVNAYYQPLKNQMVFPAGILQPPFYSVEASAAVNFGSIGMVVGHELTHGFDDEGSQFDASGNLKDWWSGAVKSRFQSRTECVEQQYSKYEALPELPVNGKLTLGENIADLGGVKLAFYAYRSARAGAQRPLVADGFSEDQQFFLAAGQIWCSKYREEYARMAVQVDPHAPPRFRVNGSLASLPEFAEAFACTPGAPMAPKERCSVW